MTTETTLCNCPQPVCYGAAAPEACRRLLAQERVRNQMDADRRRAQADAFAYGLARKVREANSTPDCPCGRIDCEHCLRGKSPEED